MLTPRPGMRAALLVAALVATTLGLSPPGPATAHAGGEPVVATSPVSSGAAVAAAADIDAAAVTATRAAVGRSGAAGAAGGEASWPPDALPGSLVVTTAPGATADVRTAVLGAGTDAAGAGRRPARAVTDLTDRVLKVEVDPGTEAAAATALRGHPDVVAVEPDTLRSVAAVPDDPGYAAQYAHQQTGAEAAWDVVTDAPGVRVAVIDSGIVADHPDLAGLVVEQVDAQTGSIQPGTTGDNDVCEIGHGTWVAGVMGALGNNGTDVAGVTWDGLEILDVNFAFDSPETCAAGSGPDSATIAGIRYATQQGVDIVNLSLGGNDLACPTAMQTALDDAIAAGITVIAASGNAGPGTIGVPASCNGVISVSGTGPDTTVTPYASTNPFIDVAAPGGLTDQSPDDGVLTTSWWQFGQRTESVAAVQGTSFAAPYVTGLAALLLAVDPDLTPAEIEAVLEGTAEDLGDEGRDEDYGWGLVQAGDAVELVASGAPLPDLAPDPQFNEGTRVGARYGGESLVQRVALGDGETEPVTQAVAFSQALFAGVGTGGPQAAFGVLARADDFADALAGSPLTLGAAPLLFSPSGSGGLDPLTAAELTRVLQPGSPVFVLGGEVALPAGVDSDLRALGFEPLRLSGAVREETAVQVAGAVLSLTQQVGLPPSRDVILAGSYVWYDAITAGALAAGGATPVLLTGEQLAEPTRAALAALQPEGLYVVGGDVRIPQATRDAAAQAAGVQPIVLAGAARDETAVRVAAEIERLYDGVGLSLASVVALNLTRDDGWNYGLSAAPFVAVVPSVFLPLIGDDGSELSDPTVEYFQGFGLDVVVNGDVDIVSDAAADGMSSLLATRPGEES